MLVENSTFQIRTQIIFKIRSVCVRVYMSEYIYIRVRACVCVYVYLYIHI